MLICFISDTHCQHRQISINTKGVDVLCHTGDACLRGNAAEYMDFVDWFSNIDVKNKIYIPGNHDFICQNNTRESKVYAEEHGITFLLDAEKVVDGVKFYGSPWQPYFYNWAFNFKKDNSDAIEKWNEIPQDTDVLLTHGPPKDILDVNDRGDRCGCSYLYRRIYDLKDLKAHAFGHIHEGYGTREFLFGGNKVKFINSSILDENYVIKNTPVYLEI